MKKARKPFLLLLALLWSSLLHASPVISLSMEGTFDDNYNKVSAALEDHRFFVVFEPDIGRSVSRFKERWGQDYNRNGFSALRSLVFCNPWYVNQVSNKDPQMLALCPLSVTLTQQGTTTRLHMLRPSVIGSDSPALELLKELEADLVKALTSSGARLEN